MEKIIQEVKDEFEDLKNLSSMLNPKSEFDTPYSFEKIEEWEKNNGVKIPDMYKSWLLLTSFARIMDGRIELFFPEISDPDKEDVYIGSLGYGGDSLFFSKKTGAFYAIGDEEEEYDPEVGPEAAQVAALQQNILTLLGTGMYTEDDDVIIDMKKHLEELKASQSN